MSCYLFFFHTNVLKIIYSLHLAVGTNIVGLKISILDIKLEKNFLHNNSCV